MAEHNNENHRVYSPSCSTDQPDEQNVTDSLLDISSTDCDGGDAAAERKDYVGGESVPITCVEKSDSTQSSSALSDDLDDAFASIDEDEEPLSGSELSDLRKEGDLPLEELLAVYGCSRLHVTCSVTSASGSLSVPSSNISTSGSAVVTSSGSVSPSGVSSTGVSPSGASSTGVSPLGALSTGVSLSGVSSTGEHNETYSSSEEEILSNQDLTLDKDEIARDLLMRGDNTLDHETSVHDLITIIDLKPPAVVEATKPCFTVTSASLSSQSSDKSAGVTVTSSGKNCESSRTGTDEPMGGQASSFNSSPSVYDTVTSSLQLDADDSGDDSDDSDYQPGQDHSWKKTVSVGPECQANIPDCIPFKKTASVVRTVEERLLWDPSKLSPELVDNYCRNIDELMSHSKPSVNGSTDRSLSVRDDEQALYLLLQCNYNIDEALRRRQMEIIPPSDPLSLWSNEEQTNFTHGLRQYGKDFYAIQQNKVRSRSVSELVQFYYLWKKTDQYRVFLHGSSSGREKRKTASSSSSSSSDEPLSNVDETDNPSSSLPSCDGGMAHLSCAALAGPEAEEMVPSCYPSWQELTHQHCAVDGLNFLSPARQDFGVVNMAEAYHEPYTDPSGMVPDSSYYRHHRVGGGDSPYCSDGGVVALRVVDQCGLVCSPYHDTYGGAVTEQTLPYSFPTSADNCHLPYFHPHPHHYPNDALSYADPATYISPSQSAVFYPPMPLLTGPGGNGDEQHVDFSASQPLHVQYQSPHHLKSIMDEYNGLEPSAKRFKPSPVGLLDHNMVEGSGVMGMLGVSTDSRLSCSVVEACVDDIRLAGHLRVHDSAENNDLYTGMCVVGPGCLSSDSPACDALGSSSMVGETSENSSSSSSADSVVSGAAAQHDISDRMQSMNGVQHHDQSLQNNSSISGYSPFTVSTLQNMSTKMLAQ